MESGLGVVDCPGKEGGSGSVISPDCASRVCSRSVDRPDQNSEARGRYVRGGDWANGVSVLADKAP